MLDSGHLQGDDGGMLSVTAALLASADDPVDPHPNRRRPGSERQSSFHHRQRLRGCESHCM
ncbi:hypothetical protein [Kocuria sp.]|uniref:hypothetical protein n=1 Tax=Kocuria sp. TaxID=1871328 RepID=UPI002811C272|nr:hypothetical protein [Kocuria sp.]